MLKLIGKISGMLCKTVDMAEDLVDAGRCQTVMIKEASEFDAAKKHFDLGAQLEAFKLEHKLAPKPAA